MISKQQRQERIRELVERNHVSNQDQLIALLATESIVATQATLSRDLRELRIAKRGGIYVLPGPAGPARREQRQLQRALRDTVTAAERAGQFVVLRTGPGLARAVAISLDAAGLGSVIGTIAGTDTVMIATPSWNQADELVALVRKLAKLPKAGADHGAGPSG